MRGSGMGDDQVREMVMTSMPLQKVRKKKYKKLEYSVGSKTASRNRRNVRVRYPMVYGVWGKEDRY